MDAQQTRPSRHRGFQDAHLTAKQKMDFWTWKMEGVNADGSKYTSTVVELALLPNHADQISNAYTELCKSWLPDGGVERALLTGPSNIALAGDKPNSLTEKPAHGELPLLCICGGPLDPFDDGYCRPCWTYFTVYAKACAIQKWLSSPVSDSQPQATARNAYITPPRSSPSTAFGSSPTPANDSPARDSPTVAARVVASSTSQFTKYLTTPEIIDLSKPQNPARSAKSNKQRSKCKQCAKEFPVNLRKNDGKRCTRCCNKMKKAQGSDADVQIPSTPPSSAIPAPATTPEDHTTSPALPVASKTPEGLVLSPTSHASSTTPEDSAASPALPIDFEDHLRLSLLTAIAEQPNPTTMSGFLDPRVAFSNHADVIMSLDD